MKKLSLLWLVGVLSLVPAAQAQWQTITYTLRGGWNATSKVGYCISRLLFENGHPYGELKMVNFLKGGTEILGRPVDVAQAPDGSLLFSDDFGNKVYRLKYVGK